LWWRGYKTNIQVAMESVLILLFLLVLIGIEIELSITFILQDWARVPLHLDEELVDFTRTLDNKLSRVETVYVDTFRKLLRAQRHQFEVE